MPDLGWLKEKQTGHPQSHEGHAASLLPGLGEFLSLQTGNSKADAFAAALSWSTRMSENSASSLRDDHRGALGQQDGGSLIMPLVISSNLNP